MPLAAKPGGSARWILFVAMLAIFSAAWYLYASRAGAGLEAIAGDGQAAVAEAYGWGEDWRAGRLDDDAILARLFALNQSRAA